MWLDEIDRNDEGVGNYGISSQGNNNNNTSLLKSPIRSKNGESKLSLKKKRNQRQKKNITLSRRKRSRYIIDQKSTGEEEVIHNKDTIRTNKEKSIIPIPSFTPLQEEDDNNDDGATIRIDLCAKNKVDLKNEQHPQGKESENIYQDLKQKINHQNPKRQAHVEKRNDSENTSTLVVDVPNTSSFMSIQPHHTKPKNVVVTKSILSHQHDPKTNTNNPSPIDHYPQTKKNISQSNKELNNGDMLENDKISQYFQSNSKHNKTCPRKMPGKENEYKRESIGKRKIPNKSMMDVSDSDDDWLVPSPAFSKKKFSSRKENILQNQLKEKGSKREPNCIIIDLEDNHNYNNIVQNNDSDKNSSKQITTGASSTPQNTTECDSKNISYKESITNNNKDSGNNKPSFKSKKNISQKVEDKSIVTHVEQEVLPLTDDENFDISRAKKLSEKERHLDQIHNALLKTSKEGLHKASRKNENLKKVKGMNKRQKEQKLCVICSTCRCAKGSILHELEQSTINESKSPLQNFARSDNEVERALLSRLSRLEKSAAWYDHLCFKVNRELKKHRSKALKRLLDENSVKEKPTFLEDVAIGDDFVMKHGIAPSIPSSLAQRARKKVFSFRKKRQPTLTQMLGKDQNLSDESTDECELEHDTKEDSKCVLQSNSSEQKHENEEIIDLMDESHEIVETCDDEISSEKYLVEEDTFENQMAEFYDASYRKDNRIQELGFHTKTGNIMWDLSKSSEIPNISHIRVAELSSNAERVESSTITEKNSCEVNNECSSFHKTDQFTNMMQSFDFTQSNDQADGMSHLLELFNGVDNSTEPFSFVDANDDASIVWNSRDKNGIPNFSQLSQQGQANAQEIERNVDNDPEKRILIENICPNWKENVSFALLQKNPIELNYALDNLNEERGRMVRVMEKITNAYEQRNLVLDLYQSALEKSLKRSSTIDDNSCSVKTGKNETSSKTSERSSTINLAGCLQNQILQDRNKLVDSSIKTDLFTIDESDSEDSLLSCSQNPSSKKERLDQSDSHSEKLPPIQHKNARDEIVQSDDSEQLNVDLTSLETTKLKLLMEKYGLKAQSRSRMINILSEVFDTIRKDSFGIEETSPIQSQNSVQSRDGTSEPLKVTKKRKQKLQDIEELRRLCREAIDKDTRLKLRILSHESIEFSEIEQTILNAGIQISKKSLSDWLDKSKIRYADPWRQRK